MADRLAGVKAVKVGETLTDVKMAPPAYTLVAAALTEVDAKPFGKTLADLKAKVLVGTFLDTLSEVVAKTNAENLLVWRLRHRAKQKLTLLQDWRKNSCQHTD